MDGKDPLSNNNQELLELLIQMPVNLSLSKPEEEGTALDKSGPCVEYGPIIDYFLTAYWRCVLFGLEYSTDSHVIPLLQSHDDHMTKINSKNPETIAELCIEYIDIAMNDIATPILCFSVLVPKVWQQQGKYIHGFHSHLIFAQFSLALHSVYLMLIQYGPL